MTCGDLGTQAYAVESALRRWFKLATLWKAVLLLDEADVSTSNLACVEIWLAIV
jgi:hypothetical protein